jgi:hypothetical protein
MTRDPQDDDAIEPADDGHLWRYEDRVALRAERSCPSLRGRFKGSGLAEMLAAERAGPRGPRRA